MIFFCIVCIMQEASFHKIQKQCNVSFLVIFTLSIMRILRENSKRKKRTHVDSNSRPRTLIFFLDAKMQCLNIDVNSTLFSLFNCDPKEKVHLYLHKFLFLSNMESFVCQFERDPLISNIVFQPPQMPLIFQSPKEEYFIIKNEEREDKFNREAQNSEPFIIEWIENQRAYSEKDLLLSWKISPFVQQNGLHPIAKSASHLEDNFKEFSNSPSTSDEDQFENYERKVTNEGESRKFLCLWIDCKGFFENQDLLVSHIERAHIVGRKEDFSCFWFGCPRRNRPFNARYKLLIHSRVHSGHKPNLCSFKDCKKSFARLENLKIHIRSHTGERPYVCLYCKKAFSNSSDRAKHQRTHFDSRPYACKYCTKKYTDPSSLRKHAKVHFYTDTNDLNTIMGYKKSGSVSSVNSIESSSSLSLSPTSPNQFNFEENYSLATCHMQNFGSDLENAEYDEDNVFQEDNKDHSGRFNSEMMITNSDVLLSKQDIQLGENIDLTAMSNSFDWISTYDLGDIEDILGNN